MFANSIRTNGNQEKQSLSVLARSLLEKAVHITITKREQKEVRKILLSCF